MNSILLKPRIPNGAWLALALVTIGLALIVVGQFLLPSLITRIGGIIVAVLGALLLGLAYWGLRRQRVWVTVDNEGYTIEGPHGEYSGYWLDVTDVQVSRKTAKIALYHGAKRRTIIAHPARRNDDAFMRVREEITTHVEALAGA